MLIGWPEKLMIVFSFWPIRFPVYCYCSFKCFENSEDIFGVIVAVVVFTLPFSVLGIVELLSS